MASKEENGFIRMLVKPPLGVGMCDLSSAKLLSWSNLLSLVYPLWAQVWVTLE